MLNQIPYGMQNPNMYFPGQFTPNINAMTYDNNVVQELEKKVKDLETRLSNIEKRLNMYQNQGMQHDYQTSIYMM